jgi:hypothetical protein
MVVFRVECGDRREADQSSVSGTLPPRQRKERSSTYLDPKSTPTKNWITSMAALGVMWREAMICGRM